MFSPCKVQQSFLSKNNMKKSLYFVSNLWRTTVETVSVWGVILVPIFPHLDWIQILVPIFPHLNWIWRDTKYLTVFSPNVGNGDQNNSSYEHFLSSALRKRIKKAAATFKMEFYLKLVNVFQSYTNDKKGSPS